MEVFPKHLKIELPHVPVTLLLSSHFLASLVPEGTLQTSEEGKQPTVLPSYNAYEPHQ